MTEPRGERNEFSGEAHGSVVQTGSVHGDIRFDLSPDRIDLLSAHGLLVRLVKIPADEAAIKLAMVDPGKAAEVIAMMPRARRIAVIPYMDPMSAAAILKQLPDEVAATLSLAIRAAQAISIDAARWHHLLGDASGVLCGEELSARSPAGFSHRYEQGTVYWNERTGTGMVSATIEKYYRDHRGISGELGYPVDREMQANARLFETSGTCQRFEFLKDYGTAVIEKADVSYGAEVYASEGGVFATWGGIGEYHSVDVLGLPLSEVMQVDGGVGRYRQIFQGGTVYWSAQTGAACVGSPIRKVHEQDLSRFGLPIGDEQSAARSPTGFGGVFQRFQGDGESLNNPNVAIYSSEYGTFPVSGVILGLFERSGGTAGPFGFPVSPERSSRLGNEQTFELGGFMIRDGLECVRMVGEVYQLWYENARELGWPTSEERILGNGPDLVQFFDGGVVSVVDGIAELWLRPAD